MIIKMNAELLQKLEEDGFVIDKSRTDKGAMITPYIKEEDKFTIFGGKMFFDENMRDYINGLGVDYQEINK